MNRVVVLVLTVLILTLSAAGAVSAGSSAAPDAPPAGWVTVKSEGFEGSFPSSGWTVTDLSSDGFQRFWGADDFKPHSGTWSAWPASGGAQAVDPAVPPNQYPNDLSTQMIYGPFDLSDALDAQVEFYLWYETEAGFDFVYFASSADINATFTERGQWDDTSSGVWELITTPLTSYIGDNSVWLRWDFFSDYLYGLGGAFVDDITISKRRLDPPAPVTIGHTGTTVNLSWQAATDALSYEVWRSVNAPYFTPGSSCATPPAGMTCNSVTTLSRPDPNAIGSTINNYSYIVRSVNGAVKSRVSNRVGEFDFALVKGG